MLPRADMSGREVHSEGHDLIKFTGGQPDLLELQQNGFRHLISISVPPSSQGSQAGQSDTGQIIHV